MELYTIVNRSISESHTSKSFPSAPSPSPGATANVGATCPGEFDGERDQLPELFASEGVVGHESTCRRSSPSLACVPSRLEPCTNAGNSIDASDSEYSSSSAFSRDAVEGRLRRTSPWRPTAPTRPGPGASKRGRARRRTSARPCRSNRALGSRSPPTVLEPKASNLKPSHQLFPSSGPVEGSEPFGFSGRRRRTV